MVLGTGSRALGMLGKHSLTELQQTCIFVVAVAVAVWPCAMQAILFYLVFALSFHLANVFDTFPCG